MGKEGQAVWDLFLFQRALLCLSKSSSHIQPRKTPNLIKTCGRTHFNMAHYNRLIYFCNEIIRVKYESLSVSYMSLHTSLHRLLFSSCKWCSPTPNTLATHLGFVAWIIESEWLVVKVREGRVGENHISKTGRDERRSKSSISLNKQINLLPFETGFQVRAQVLRPEDGLRPRLKSSHGKGSSKGKESWSQWEGFCR